MNINCAKELSNIREELKRSSRCKVKEELMVNLESLRDLRERLDALFPYHKYYNADVTQLRYEISRTLTLALKFAKKSCGVVSEEDSTIL